MSLNSIKLDPSLLSALFSSNLVLTEEPSPKVSETNRPEDSVVTSTVSLAPVQFLGRNGRKFVILVHYPNTVHIEEAAFEFVSSVLKACQLNAADVAIVNMANQTPDLQQLQQELQPSLILNFATPVLPAGLPSGLPILEPVQLEPFFLHGGAPSQPIKSKQ